MTRRPLALVLLAALTACASGGTEGTAVTAPTTTEESASSEPSAAPTLSTTFVEQSRAPEGAIEILMLFPKFEPKVASAEAGTVAFFLKNERGDVRPLLHNFLLGTAIDAPPLAVSPILASETSGTFTVHGLEPGTYTYWCTVPSGDGTPHYQLGMVGTLTVTE
jgi:plastocyanin